MIIDKNMLGNKIISVEEPKNVRGNKLILTTDKNVKIFNWVPIDRFKDIFMNPKGWSDEMINQKWKEITLNMSNNTTLCISRNDYEIYRVTRNFYITKNDKLIQMLKNIKNNK